MHHQVPWNRQILNDFIKYGELTEYEIKIMEMRCKDVPRYLIASELCTSESTVARIVDKLKDRYDSLHDRYPDIFPKRRFIKGYTIKYSDFRGELTARTTKDTYSVDFRDKKFDSLEEARKYVVAQIEEMAKLEFGLLDKVRMNITMDFELEINPK